MNKRPPDARAREDKPLEELFADVVPLPDHGRVTHARRLPRPIAVQRLRDERAALIDSLSDHIAWDADVETGEELVYVRDGMSRQTVRRLRRGHWVVQHELDLHGHTTAEARAALAEFLHDCLRRGARCVRIVHGKGLRSKNRLPILKTKVAHWLKQRDEVLAYCQARQADGGGGAVIVLLKARAV